MTGYIVVKIYSLLLVEHFGTDGLLVAADLLHKSQVSSILDCQDVALVVCGEA